MNNNSALGENDSLVYDSSRAGHNGSVLGGAEYIASGKYAGAYNFTGGSGINISASEDFNVDEFTISLWVNVEKENFTTLATGSYSVCGLLENRKTLCWGKNDEGQLGDNTTIQKSYPVEVYGNYNFSQIDGYGYSYCGLLQNGSMACWGDNTYGQLGDGTTTQRNTPKIVNGGYNFSKVYRGRYHTCGKLINSSILCWGYNGYSLLGAAYPSPQYSPVEVFGGYPISKFVAGHYSNFALLTNGSLIGQGDNGNGELGINSTTSSPTPVMVENYTFKDFDASGSETCGILTNGTLMCWGYNINGQVGNNGSTDVLLPTKVLIDELVKNISLSQGYTNCIITESENLYCWGYNNAGQVGDNTRFTRKTPVPFTMEPSIDKFFPGHGHTCGMYQGEIYCWGNNRYGQSGIGRFSYSSKPIYFPYNLQNIQKIDFAFEKIMILLSNGTLLAMGISTKGELGSGKENHHLTTSPEVINGNFSDFYTRTIHTCGILSNGSTVCLGDNTYGEFGNGSIGNSFGLTYVSGGYNFSEIISGNNHVCGILSNNSLLCWGQNTYGQLGIGNTTQMFTPTYVSGGYNFSEIISGNNHVCGILSNNSLLCWGQNTYGQLGIGNTTDMYTPQYVLGGYNFSSISIGFAHTCGLLQNGSAFCWGRNQYGQLGIGNTTDMYTPQYVLGGYNFSEIDSGIFHSCGLLQNGSALCWGQNTYGQLGIGNITHMYFPNYVTGGHNFSEIFIGGYNGAGKLQTGELMVWGDANAVQLGEHLQNPYGNASRVLKGKLIWKDPFNFAMGYSYSGELISFINGDELRADLNEGWNHIVLSFDNGISKLYINGDLNHEVISTRKVNHEDLDIVLGENSSGIVDEIMMWNRTLTASEIQKVYESSLQQRNHTAWEFYSTQTLSSVGTYSYTLFATDTTGSFSILRRIIKYVVETVSEYVSPGGSISYTVTETKLQEGQTRQLRKGAKVKLEFSGQGSKTIEIVSVKENLVIVKISGVEVEVVNGTTQKIDVNNDGFYDLEVSVEDISSTGSARLKFKEIYEAVESDVENAVEEGVKEDIIDDEPEVVDEKSKWWIYVVITVIVLALIYFIFVKKK